jgi:glycosyltransferase involved in cell wall biosynthesis
MISTQPLLVIVPALNEQETIQQVVSEIRAEQFDVLVLDDGSTDDTANRAEAAGATVLRLPVNLGVGGALRAGFRFSVDNNYAAVVQVDADGQHPANQIRDLIVAAEQHHAHLVIGSRYLSPDATLTPTASRRFAMRLLGKVVSRAAGHTITDSTSGFRIICEPLLSEFAREFPAYYLGDTYEATIGAARAGYRIAEVPAALGNRNYGKSSAGSLRAIVLIAKVLMVTVLRLQPRLHMHQYHGQHQHRD